MDRPRGSTILMVLVGIIGIMGGMALAKGGFFIGKHEGDTLHFADIVLRLAEGQAPHRDFMTPIGVMAFAPVALFVRMGQGVGSAILMAQVLMALVMAAPVWWVAVSRLPARLAALFAVVVMVLVLALVHGEVSTEVSISMHYNRWAWAAAYIAVVAALVPPVYRKNAGLDGVVIGLAMAFLVLVKVTYFIAFAGPVFVALLMTRQFRATGVAAVTGAVVAGLVTVVLGVDFWLAYIGDLAAVAASETRAAPGQPFGSIVAAPAYLGGSIAMIAGVILLRQAGQSAGGLVLLLLFPAVAYVTFQNFGNDPQWLFLAAILLFALLPAEGARNGAGWDLRRAVQMVAVAMLAFGLPSMVNLVSSPFRHFAVDTADYTALVPGNAQLADLQANTVRLSRVDVLSAADRPGEPFADWREAADRDEPTEFMGETLSACSYEMGMTAVFVTMADDLVAAGFGGTALYVADIFNPYWMFGDFKVIHGAAPWLYGGLPGYEDAELLMVPACPMSAGVREQVLDALTDAGTEGLEEVRRTPLYTLYRKN